MTKMLSMNIMHHFYHKTHEDVSSGSEYDSEKQTFHSNKNIILDLLLNKSKSFKWHVSLVFFFSQRQMFFITYDSD